MGVLGRLARKYGIYALVLAAVVTVPCALRVRRLGLETNLIRIFPSDAPVIRDFLYFSENFGVSDTLLILVRHDEAGAGGKVAGLHKWLQECGYFTWADRQEVPGDPPATVILAFPRESSMNQPFCMEAMDAVADYMRDHKIEARFGGPPAGVTDATRSMERDVLRTGTIAMVLVAAILAFSFGDPLFPLVSLVPVAMAITWSLAFAERVWGSVAFVTAALPTALIGIGIDYALHIRAVRLEFRGDAPHAVWPRVYDRIGQPLLISMLTSAAAFASLLAARIWALRQLGVVGALALVLIFVLCMATMPVLLDWRDRIGFRRRGLSVRWLGRLAHKAVQHRAATFAIFLAASVPLAVGASKARISVDPMDYMDPDLPSVKFRHEFARKANLVAEPLLIATPSLAAEERVLSAIDDLIGADGPFRRADCLSRQPVGRPLGPLLRRFYGKDKRLCMVLYPSFAPYDSGGPERTAALVAEIRSRCGADIARVSGPPIVFVDLLHIVRRDMARLSLASSAVVILVLWLLVRRPRYVLSALVPLAGGVVWMLGLMHFVGKPLTAMNVVAMPLVVGLGIDYGVHIVYRLRHASVEEAVSTTGRAIVVASATTAAGFGTLCLSSSEGLVGMGVAGAAGILSCLVWSLLFLPALLGSCAPAGRPDEETEPTA